MFYFSGFLAIVLNTLLEFTALRFGFNDDPNTFVQFVGLISFVPKVGFKFPLFELSSLVVVTVQFILVALGLRG